MVRAASPIVVSSKATARIVFGSSRKETKSIPAVNDWMLSAYVKISCIRRCQFLGDTDRLLQDLINKVNFERTLGSQVYFASQKGL